MTFLNRFITISTSDPDDTRRRRILNILLAGIAAVSLLTLVISLLPFFLWENVKLLVVGSAFTLIGMSIIYLINVYWSGRAAAILFLLFLTVIFSLSDTPEQVSAGRSLFGFVIPIIMASILLTPWASFVFGVISSIIIFALALSVDIVPNLPAIIGFFVTALVSWLSARSLEAALKELRIINADLDLIVSRRTQALAESLNREQIEAGRNQAILNSIVDGVIVFDKEWNATLANPAIKGMFGLPLEMIVNRNFREFIEHPKIPMDSRRLLLAMIEHDTQPFSFRIEWGEKTLSVSAAQVYDRREEVNINTGTVIVFRDFTREAEVERLKSTFVAIVSHELRTPLNAILGYAEMFKESVYGPVNDKQVNMADRIIKNTGRLLGLINDLLDQAQMEAGKLTIELGPVKPSEMLETMHGLMDKTASDKGLRLTSEIDDSLPEILIADGERLQQILVNLVTNAVKFTDKGEVSIRLFRSDVAKWGIEVTDTGRGIPREELPYIFDTFRQVEGAATRTKGGFGLGLAIVNQLVSLMNGDIKVTSGLEKGTTFSITLPLVIP